MEEFATLYRITWRDGIRTYATATQLVALQDIRWADIGWAEVIVKVEAASIPPDLWFDVSRQVLPGISEEEE